MTRFSCIASERLSGTSKFFGISSRSFTQILDLGYDAYGKFCDLRLVETFGEGTKLISNGIQIL